jgi:hypothetical protein
LESHLTVRSEAGVARGVCEEAAQGNGVGNRGIDAAVLLVARVVDEAAGDPNGICEEMRGTGVAIVLLALVVRVAEFTIGDCDELRGTGYTAGLLALVVRVTELAISDCVELRGTGYATGLPVARVLTIGTGNATGLLEV